MESLTAIIYAVHPCSTTLFILAPRLLILDFLALIHVSSVRPRPMVRRLPVLSFSVYPETDQCKHCETMNRVNALDNVFLKSVLV